LGLLFVLFVQHLHINGIDTLLGLMVILIRVEGWSHIMMIK